MKGRLFYDQKLRMAEDHWGRQVTGNDKTRYSIPPPPSSFLLPPSLFHSTLNQLFSNSTNRLESSIVGGFPADKNGSSDSSNSNCPNYLFDDEQISHSRSGFWFCNLYGNWLIRVALALALGFAIKFQQLQSGCKILVASSSSQRPHLV